MQKWKKLFGKPHSSPFKQRPPLFFEPFKKFLLYSPYLHVCVVLWIIIHGIKRDDQLRVAVYGHYSNILLRVGPAEVNVES